MKTKTNKGNTGDAILAGVQKMYEKHAKAIAEAQMNAKGNKIKVAFSITIDGSEAEPIVKTQIAYGLRVTDSVTAVLDDPAQGGFTFLSPAEAEQAFAEIKCNKRDRKNEVEETNE